MRLILILFMMFGVGLGETKSPELLLMGKFTEELPMQILLNRATVYNPVPEQTNSDPSTTASGAKIDLSNPDKHRWIAVSRDFINEFGFSFGDTVLVTQNQSAILQGANQCKYTGIWVIQDLMNKRYTKTIDFLSSERLGRWSSEDALFITKF